MLLRPLRGGPIPAVRLQLFEQSRVDRLPVAGGQIRFDVLDLTHARDNGRDRRLGQNPRKASSGIVISCGTSGRNASARSTLCTRFSGTK